MDAQKKWSLRGVPLWRDDAGRIDLHFVRNDTLGMSSFLNPIQHSAIRNLSHDAFHLCQDLAVGEMILCCRFAGTDGGTCAAALAEGFIDSRDSL